MVTVGDYDRAMVKKIYSNHLNQKTTIDDFCNISDLWYCYVPLIFIVGGQFFKNYVAPTICVAVLRNEK